MKKQLKHSARASINPACICLIIVLTYLINTALSAATITVDTTNGGGVNVNGNCNLTEALVSANFNVAVDACASGDGGQDTIAFAGSIFSGPPLFTANIVLQQSLNISDGGVTMEPPTGTNLFVQGSGSNRLFTISGGNTLIKRMSLIGGDSEANGGAILISSPSGNSSLQLENVVASNSSAGGFGGFIGGEIGTGIFNLNVISSSFSNNSANDTTLNGGGAIGLDVATEFGFLNVFIQDSTFSGNTSQNGLTGGGAIALNIDADNSGASFGLVIEDSIFSDNSAPGGSGGAVYLNDGSNSQNGYSATVRNSRFSSNSAGKGGAIVARHFPTDETDSDTLKLLQNSFVGNSSNTDAGAVSIEFIDTLIRNNLFAMNTSGGSTATGNPGALRMDHDGANNMVVSSGDIDIRANTFFNNEGNPDELDLDTPLSGSGGGSSLFIANAVEASNPSANTCDLGNADGNYGVSSASLGCFVGPESVFVFGPFLDLISVTHPVHTMAAIPLDGIPDNPAIDLWPDFFCREANGSAAPLTTDLLGQRRDPVTGLPPDGDGDGDADCDAGSIEIVPEITFDLNVAIAGSGSGRVFSDLNGIDCPGDCAESFTEGTMVELFASADADNVFSGWSGDCSGTSTCLLTMDSDKDVTATFEPAIISYPVTVEIDGNGEGMVASMPPGIDCPSDCSEDFENNTSVVLMPFPGSASNFFGWRADCASAGAGDCQFNIDQPARAIAIFSDGDLLFLDGFE